MQYMDWSIIYAGLVIVGCAVIAAIVLRQAGQRRPEQAEANRNTETVIASSKPLAAVSLATVPDDQMSNIAPIKPCAPKPAAQDTQPKTQPRSQPQATVLQDGAAMTNDRHNEATIADAGGALSQLDDTQKHRVIYRFLPNMRGMLLRGEALEGYFSDASNRAIQRGWTDIELAQAARTGQWRRPKPQPERW